MPTAEPIEATPCTECGWRRGDAIRTRPRWFGPWRWVPSLAVVALVAWWLAAHGTAPTSYTHSTSSPVILQDPCISYSAVQAIADGAADAATVDTFAGAIRNACLKERPRTVDDRAAFVSVGFVGTGNAVREDSLIGWPVTVLWAVRNRPMKDSIAHEPASSPDDPPFIWFPPWPSKGPWESYSWTMSRRSTTEGVWDLRPHEFRFTHGQRIQHIAGPWQVSTERTVALKLNALSIPLAALWVGWLLARCVVRGWRRLVLVGCVALLVASSCWFFPSKRLLQSRAWYPPDQGSVGQTRKEVRSLGLRVNDVLGKLANGGEIRDLARRILDVAPVDAIAPPRYLVISIGPVWPSDVTQQWYIEDLRVLWLHSATDAKFIPPDIAALPRDGRFSVRLYDGILLVTLKKATASTDDVMVVLDLGWLCWIALIAVIAGAIPTSIVAGVRGWKARRRAARGLCAKCAYPIDATLSTRR